MKQGESVAVEMSLSCATTRSRTSSLCCTCGCRGVWAWGGLWGVVMGK